MVSNISQNKKPELIAPAGDLISLKAALNSGADSVFWGIKGLNMRINAKNFEKKDLKKISSLCKANKAKSYLTLNTIIFDKEIKQANEIIKYAKKYKIDAVICSDIAIMSLCKLHKMPFHISTQKSISNYPSLEFFNKQGAKMAVLARELSLDQIKEIIKLRDKNNLKIKIETFIHGAMCVSVSGRCFISQFQFGRSANRGDCLQPCRRSYNIQDPEEKYNLELENNFVISPKDLCTIDIIEKLIESKIDSFKIEGRNRSPEYVKTVTSCYRKAIDFYCDKKNILPKKTFDNTFKILKKELKKELANVYNRGFSTGFYLGKPINEWTNAYGSKATTKKSLIGPVKNYFNIPKVAEIHVQSNFIKQNEKIMIQGPTTGVIEFKANEILINNKSVTKAKKGTIITLKCPKVRKNDKVYVVRSK